MSYQIQDAGLGLRRELLSPLEEYCPEQISFMEVAPENWISLGGKLGKRFKQMTEQHQFICHGLSLNIGGPAPLDEAFISRTKQFLDQHNMAVYSEHLSYCGDDGHLYDLLPIPFTEEAVKYVAKRIQRVQNILERQLVIENVSYYTAPGQEMQEIDFIKAVLAEADCGLLLDVNNIYVNSINHRYDALEYLTALPAERIVYGHVAGHYNEADDLIVDTHGADVIDPVWDLLDKAYAHFGVFPTLLERDFNIPAVADLALELDHILALQAKYATSNSESEVLKHATP